MYYNAFKGVGETGGKQGVYMHRFTVQGRGGRGLWGVKFTGYRL